VKGALVKKRAIYGIQRAKRRCIAPENVTSYKCSLINPQPSC